jgi:uracil phosphoribosyltransferase
VEDRSLSNLTISSHPLVEHKLAALRDVRTQPADFRRAVRTLAVLLAQEALLDLPLVEGEVTTPLAQARCRVLKDSVGIFPILRAGLGMADGIIELLPEAEVWHVGLYRDEATLRPKEYYNKLPAGRRVTVALLVDPMLATGGSAAHACEIIKTAGVPRLKLLSLIAAPEGIALMSRVMPDVQIHVGAVDERLNDRGFIHPGLGDAGDRQFGTEDR